MQNKGYPTDFIEQLKEKNDIVLDMYCGVGTIGMSLAHSVKEVIGVEINTRSIQDAINNAKMNQVNNIVQYNLIFCAKTTSIGRGNICNC